MSTRTRCSLCSNPSAGRASNGREYCVDCAVCLHDQHDSVTPSELRKAVDKITNDFNSILVPMPRRT